MNQRVREIVDLLVEMIANAVDLPITEISLIERLVRRGYHLGEIDRRWRPCFHCLPVTLTEPGDRADENAPVVPPVAGTG